MVEREETLNTSPRITSLRAPEVFEARLAPMFMCCGHWSYAISFGIAGPTVSLTWTEDPNAACNQ